jgi:SAM-dependent methyltransferase
VLAPSKLGHFIGRIAINASTPPGGPSLWARARRRLILLLIREDVRGNGRHVDPEDPATPPPDRHHWSAGMYRANTSVHMATFADALRPPAGGSVRDGVIGDLADYHQLPPAEVVRRCRHWEQESVEEWQAAADLADFYNSIDSWTFDLLWYAYLQSTGYGYPETVIVADQIGAAPVQGRMLDLGSGVGVTAQFFAALGYQITLADISAPLLTFAKWRLERRGTKATYLHLPADLPTGEYDLVTALDVMAHIPDPAQTAQRLHRALRPGGLFVANFDVRRKSAENAWHLYEDDLPLRWAVERAGFAPVKLIDGIMWIYRSAPTTGIRARIRTAFGWLRLASPPARALRATRRALVTAALITAIRLGAARRQHTHPATDQ